MYLDIDITSVRHYEQFRQQVKIMFRS